MLALALAAILLLWTAVLLAFARPLFARWREPVFRHPILIIESDDWGAGPLEQADALHSISFLLQHIRDRSGRPAVMTLGVILEIPDGPAIATTDCTLYQGLQLTDPRFNDVRVAMNEGIAAGVLAPQLHGQCHYWPPALMVAARDNPALRDWLTAPGPAATEDLPSHLQSRWIDASSLPSRPLRDEAIRKSIGAEAAAYQAVFGHVPRVAVATTFVWNETVEAAWAQAGVEVVITPGHRATCRNTTGHPDCVDATMLTGERSLARQVYLVRDVYFEPHLGHASKRLVDGLQARTRQGRACLVETHRFNFLRARDNSLATLEASLKAALGACQNLRFVTPLELAHAIQSRDPVWIETRLTPRFVAWLARLDEIPRFRRIARLSGLVLPLALLGRSA